MAEAGIHSVRPIRFPVENFTENDFGQWKALAAFEGNEYYKGSTSPEVSFTVSKAMSRIIATVSENLVRGDEQVTVSGALSPPGRAGERIVLSFWVGDRRFEEQTYTEPGGVFSFRFEPSKLAERHGVPNWTGEWSVTASWQGDKTYSESRVRLSFSVLGRAENGGRGETGWGSAVAGPVSLVALVFGLFWLYRFLRGRRGSMARCSPSYFLSKDDKSQPASSLWVEACMWFW